MNATAGDEASYRAIGTRLVASAHSPLNLPSFLLPPRSFSFISRIRRRFLRQLSSFTCKGTKEGGDLIFLYYIRRRFDNILRYVKS